MLFIKRAKILSTRLDEFFEGGDIDAIATSPDKLVHRANQAAFSDLRKSGIHQACSEVVVHTICNRDDCCYPESGHLRCLQSPGGKRTFVFCHCKPPK